MACVAPDMRPLAVVTRVLREKTRLPLADGVEQVAEDILSALYRAGYRIEQVDREAAADR